MTEPDYVHKWPSEEMRISFQKKCTAIAQKWDLYDEMRVMDFMHAGGYIDDISYNEWNEYVLQTLKEIEVEINSK